MNHVKSLTGGFSSPTQNRSRTKTYMKINRWLALAGVAAAMSFGANQGLAQNNQPGQGGQGGQGGGGRPGRGNFDPAQFRERMMERTKETLEITDDAEWKALEPLVQKVMDARMSSMGGM